VRKLHGRHLRVYLIRHDDSRSAMKKTSWLVLGLLLVSTYSSAIPEAEKFDRFLSVSEGISRLISNRDLGFSHDSTPVLVSTFSSGVSAVP